MIVLGLGGNVGDDAAIVTRFGAVASAFLAWGTVRASSVYRTAPIGGVAQGAFLNAAIVVRQDVEPTPRELIDVVLETERLLGRDRRREARWGPRTIDIDVLLWDDRVTHSPGLEVPHPRLAQRAFALRPVADLLGEAYVIPGTARSIDELLRACGDQGVELTDLAITVA
jgi:2-amino-4-hydroxy-6-hydroxymethyldihydropteridine diphosphokinase